MGQNWAGIRRRCSTWLVTLISGRLSPTPAGVRFTTTTTVAEWCQTVRDTNSPKPRLACSRLNFDQLVSSSNYLDRRFDSQTLGSAIFFCESHRVRGNPEKIRKRKRFGYVRPLPNSLASKSILGGTRGYRIDISEWSFFSDKCVFPLPISGRGPSYLSVFTL